MNKRVYACKRRSARHDALVGLVAIAVRLVFGLGASTALSDAVPWGLWKILNMVAGVALATGGFTLACAVYVFGSGEVPTVASAGHPDRLSRIRFVLLRPAAGHRPPAPHLASHRLLERAFFPVRGGVVRHALLHRHDRRDDSHRPGEVSLPASGAALHRTTLPVVIAGITFSTLHHSSLGSLFLVAPSRLHEIWYTSLFRFSSSFRRWAVG